MSRRHSHRTIRVLRRLHPAVEALAEARPAFGLSLLGKLGGILADGPGTWRTPSEEDVVALLGPLPPQDVRRIRRGTTSQELRNQAVRRILARRGAGALAPTLARVEAEPLLRLHRAGTAVVLVGWHQGPAWTDTLALQRLGISFLSPTTRGDLSEGLGVVSGGALPLAGDGTDAAFLKAALASLEAGGVVEIHLDWRQSRGVRVKALGRWLTIGAGAAWLSRRTRAALVPVTRQWLGASARSIVTFHEPLPEPDVPRDEARAFETASLRSAVAFFDAWLRAHPETLRVPRIRHLLSLPPAGLQMDGAEPQRVATRSPSRPGTAPATGPPAPRAWSG